MIADALKILGDHQKIQRDLALPGLAGDGGDERLLDGGEVLVDQIVLPGDGAGQIHVAAHERVDALRDHGAGLLRHAADECAVKGVVAEEEGDDLRDVRGLIADALHVGDHLERGGDLPQIAGDGLLLQKQLQAQGLDRALLLVRLLLELPHGGRERHILLLQGLCGQADGLRAGCAHLGQLLVEGGELLVKFTSH